MAKLAKRETGVLALSIGLAVLAGCGESRGTGKHGELYIRPHSAVLASGLTTEIRINDLRTWPENKDPLLAERVERWDLEGTTLEVLAPAGFDFEITFEKDWRTSVYHLVTRCDAEPGIAHEVRVRVMAGGKVRYEDAFDLTCYEPTRLELWDVWNYYAAPGKPGVGRYFVGGAIEANVVLFADTPRGEVLVGGGGLELTDSQGILRMGEPQYHIERNTGTILDVVAAGVGPELSYRGASLRLPMEAVLDEGWRLELAASQDPPSNQGLTGWTVDAIARGSDGSELHGVQSCSWTTQRAGAEKQDVGCRIYLWGPPGSDVCVTAHGRTTCGP